MNRKKVLLLLSCCLFCKLLLSAAQLWAQEAEETAVTKTQSITVTANKIEEGSPKKCPRVSLSWMRSFWREKGNYRCSRFDQGDTQHGF